MKDSFKKNNKEEQLTVEDMLDDARSPFMEFDLPTGILHEGTVLRSCVIREMTGEEEDILASRKMTFSKKIQLIVERCVEKLGVIDASHPEWSRILQQMTINDRTFLMVRIRIASLGPEMTMKVACPHCAQEANHTVSLLDFRVDGLADSAKRTWEGVLPRSKKPYCCRVFTVQDEEKILRLSEKEDAGSLLLLSRLSSLDGRIPTVQDVKKLPLQDRNHLRNEIKSKEGSVDDEVEILCPSCSEEFKVEMEFGHQNFFFPSES